MFRSRTRRLAFLLTVAVLVLIGVTSFASIRPTKVNAATAQFVDASLTPSLAAPAGPDRFQAALVSPRMLGASPTIIVIPLPSPLWTGLSLIAALAVVRGFCSIRRMH